MKNARPEACLERLLMALERELIEATDEEILAAAAELGMNPSMKGSAAFLGVKSPVFVSGSPVSAASKERAKERAARKGVPQ